MFNGVIAHGAMARGLQSQDILYALGKDTGGQVMLDSNDLALGIARAARAVTGYYLLGYYSRNVAKDGRYRRVEVRLAPGRSGDLEYRSGYYGEKDFKNFNRAEKERQLADALKLGDPITEILIAVAVNYFQISSAEYFVPVSVRMPGSELAPAEASGASPVDIDLIGEIKDQHGVTYRNVRDLLRIPVEKGSGATRRLIQYETGFTVLPGSYAIKLLVRNDATGRIGTFESPFTIPNLEREVTEVPLSSIVLSQQRVTSTDAVFTVKQKVASDVANPLVDEGQKLVPAVGSTFDTARPLHVMVQAYQRDAPVVRPLTAYATFYRDGMAVSETPILGIEQRDPKTRALTIRFTIGPHTLPAGAYTCQITVLDSIGGRAAFRRFEVTMR